MPCYQVNLLTVKFNVKNIDLLIKTLKDLNLNPKYIANTNIIYLNYSREKINLNNDTISIRNANLVNIIKKKYSENALEMLTKKKKWILNKKNKNQGELRRY